VRVGTRFWHPVGRWAGGRSRTLRRVGHPCGRAVRNGECIILYSVRARLCVARQTRRNPRAGEVALHVAADPWEGATEGAHSAELELVSPPAPRRVIAGLLAPAGVPPDRLQMTARVTADPHVPPGRRDGKRTDPRQGRVVPDRHAVRVEAAEPMAVPSTRDSRLQVAGMPEAAARRGRWLADALAIGGSVRHGPAAGGRCG
jgi:hypothetical protein